MRRKPLFPPPATATGRKPHHKGRQAYSLLTVNGRVRLCRIRWHSALEGSQTPVDRMLDEAPVRAEATPTGLRIVRTGPPGHEVALEITTLSPDERASVSCVVRGAGDVLAQARAACEGMVVQNPRD